jgi:V8-like Glu-specific endopeptidase
LTVGQRIARFLGLAVAGMLPVLLITGGAGAIIGGTVDNDSHPNVGFVFVFDKNGNLREGCTGTLIAETVVLTAAHCLPPGYEIAVTFNPTVDLTKRSNGFIPATDFETNEKYDVGVVHLARPANAEPAALPDRGALEQYKKGASFTYVGYGFDRADETDIAHFTRRTLTSPLLRLSHTQLATRNPNGSICKGDSGGPVFSDGGVLVALGNYTSGDCKGTNSGPRLDTGPVLSFLKANLG